MNKHSTLNKHKLGSKTKFFPFKIFQIHFFKIRYCKSRLKLSIYIVIIVDSTFDFLMNMHGPIKQFANISFIRYPLR